MSCLLTLSNRLYSLFLVKFLSSLFVSFNVTRLFQFHIICCYHITCSYGISRYNNLPCNWLHKIIIMPGVDNVYSAETQSHCMSSPSSHDECRRAPDGCQPLDQEDGLELLAHLYAAMKLHPSSPFIITQPES